LEAAVREQANPFLTIMGVIPTMYDRHWPEHRVFLEEMRRECDQVGIQLFTPVAGLTQLRVPLAVKGESPCYREQQVAKGLLRGPTAFRSSDGESARVRRQVSEMPFNWPVLIQTASIDPNPDNPESTSTKQR
jgi:hypothetical protein